MVTKRTNVTKQPTKRTYRAYRAEAPQYAAVLPVTAPPVRLVPVRVPGYVSMAPVDLSETDREFTMPMALRIMIMVLAAVVLAFAVNLTSLAGEPLEAAADNDGVAKRTVEQVEASYAYGPVTQLHQGAAAGAVE